MNFSDKLSELSHLSYFALERRKRVKNFILGGLVLYSVGLSYLLYKRGEFNVRSRWNIFSTIYQYFAIFNSIYFGYEFGLLYVMGG